MKDSVEYIKSLDLVEISENIRLPDYSTFETDVENPSFLNFKGLNSFSFSVSKQNQEDVLNSLLLAQRAATKAFPEDKQVYSWYKMYFKILQNLGWLLTQKDFNSFDEQSNTLEIDKVIFSVLQNLLTAQQMTIIMKSLKLIQSLGDNDKRLKAFERNTHGHEKGNFQLDMAEQSNGNVTILGSGFILESTKNITNILFLKFDKQKVNVKFSLYKATLVPSEYNKYREIVKQKLGNVNDFIASLDV